MSYVMGMSCVHSGSGSNSLLSANITRPLAEVIKEIEVNHARLHYCLLNKDPTMSFDIDTHKVALGIEILESYEDPFMMASANDEEDKPLEKEPAPKKKKKKGKSQAVDVRGPPVLEQDKGPTDAPACFEVVQATQDFICLDNDIEILDDSLNSVGHNVCTNDNGTFVSLYFIIAHS
ncbi:uncharacterized protein F5147DRAFT_777733 [Suillus discolor]|uniref:Uncharacterized protein n=1 Tax=Suillus discolor TaxID=1912936 RepID=A0A9P7JQB0_9AGAM|nr:uncharacterized protein F5147DRAFT_777733 [Suillus discolor]KAG2098237.1 hypothetical protein F5147DRAFT_777733 [Suillus discolor]